jgi:5-methylthioadenosine/S-adenosylhomocysteine deaminase
MLYRQLWPVLWAVSGLFAQSPRTVDLIVRGGPVVTMDSGYHVYDDGLIAIAGDHIVDVGDAVALGRRYTAKQVIEGRGMVALPGLLNLHAHSSMIMLRGLADDYVVEDWFRKLGPLHMKYDPRPGIREVGNELACLEMLRRGTTTFVEMYHFPEKMAAAASHTGLRALVTLRLPFDRDSGKLDKAQATAEWRKLWEDWKTNPLITPGLAAHQPNTVPVDVLRFTSELATQYNVPLLIHMGEGAEETRFMQEKFGKSPAEFLDSIGFFSTPVLIAHAIRLSGHDIQIIKERGASISHNPQSNAKLASGIARIPELLKAGVPVGLGTDSVVSNNNLDIFEEMNFAVKMQRLSAHDWHSFTAREALHMATLGAARAIHKEKEIGSLEVGKKADVILVDFNKPELQPLYDYYSGLVYTARGSNVDTSIVNGKVLMRGRKVLTVDENAVMERVAAHRNAIFEDLRRSATDAR